MSGKKHTRITDVAQGQYAISLFAAAKCNLRCSYCYIHKDENAVPKIHKKILENIESGAYIDTIKHWFDPRSIVTIAHWGSEPTLTLSQFYSFYETAFLEFENLKTVSFSTNLMSKNCVEILVSFAEFLSKMSNKLNRDITFEFQISLDGPQEITDSNRSKDGFKIITSNMIELFKRFSENDIINNSRCTISSFNKSTLTMNQFKLLSTIDGYSWYVQSFDDLYTIINSYIESNKHIKLGYAVMPTLIYPGDYTKSDGETLAMACKSSIEYYKTHKCKTAIPKILYYDDFIRFTHSLADNQYAQNHRIWTCSAGDSCPAIDEDLNIVYCHHAFYNTNNEYFNQLLNNNNINNTSGRTKTFDSTKITLDDSEEELIKKLMFNRSFHDSYKLKVQAGIILIMQYAKLGMISSKYKNHKLATLLSKYIQSCRACPADNIESMGSASLCPTPMVIAFGNGLFETLLKYYEKELKNDKS